MKTVAIIQARMSSTRLPGKIFQEIAGKPMLTHVIERAKAAGVFDTIIIATSTDPSDDVVETFCKDQGHLCVRGSLKDVLKRYAKAATAAKADVITRLTADCPLLDPAVIRRIVQAFDPQKHDYVSNVIKRTYPKGLDTEVFSRKALVTTEKNAKLPHEREHVTKYIHAHPELFRIHHVKQKDNLSELRWTVDMPDDLAFVRAVYDELKTDLFGQEEILALLKRHPHIQKINAGIA